MTSRRQLVRIVGSAAILAACTAAPASTPLPTATPTVLPTVTPSSVAGPYQSELYGFTLTSTEWTGTGASTAWDGTGSPGDLDPTVDALVGPESFRAFAYGLSTSVTLREFADASRAANAKVHPCPEKPASTKKTTIDGVPALVDTMDCGVFAMTAYAVHDGRATVFFAYDQLDKEAVVRAGFGSLLELVSFDR
jgi:hypothetical protein